MTDIAGQLESSQLGRADALRWARDILTVLTATPKPPGTRVDFRTPVEPEPLASGKVVSVRRPDERLDRWEVDVKLFAPSRRARDHLATLVSGGAEPGAGGRR